MPTQTYVCGLESGKSGPKGVFRFLAKLSDFYSQYGLLKLSSSDNFALYVTERGLGTNKSVDINIGDGIFPFFTDYYGGILDYVLHAWLEGGTKNLVTSVNTSGGDRYDAIVAYVDPTAYDDTNENNPGALKFVEVQGTIASSGPDDAAIYTALGGLSYGWLKLAVIKKINNYTQVVNADITDRRREYIVGRQTVQLQPFIISGNLSVGSDASYHLIVTEGVTSITTLYASVREAPVGASILIDIYNVTQSAIVGSLTIGDGNRDDSEFIDAVAVEEGDTLRLDINQVGSGTPGADLIVYMDHALSF